MQRSHDKFGGRQSSSFGIDPLGKARKSIVDGMKARKSIHDGSHKHEVTSLASSCDFERHGFENVGLEDDTTGLYHNDRMDEKMRFFVSDLAAAYNHGQQFLYALTYRIHNLKKYEKVKNKVILN